MMPNNEARLPTIGNGPWTMRLRYYQKYMVLAYLAPPERTKPMTTSSLPIFSLNRMEVCKAKGIQFCYHNRF